MGGYAKYIATREGVEKIDDSQRHAPATIKQQELIMRILRDFPDAKESHEYEDYRREKTVGNASEFITRALEENMDRVADSKTYADYIATRPRAERFGSHGLFTDDGVQVQLSKVSQELNEYTGHVYTTILSLRREDAARLGFDNGSRWRDFLRGQTQTISENLKIPMEHLRWYAAYHDEGHHPHIHMIAYSTVPGEGYLSDKGVETMRSTFARDIFKQDMHQIYAQQAQFRDQLREQGRESVAEIVAQINSGVYSNTKVEALLVSLSDRLSRTSGKKVYGYLKADVKAIVDEIVAELAADERIRKLYDLWYEQREDVLRTYTDHFPERVPLEQNKEFKTIRNAVIQEAMKIVSGIQQAAELEPQQDVWEVDLPSGEEPDMEAMADPSYWTAQFQPKFTEVEPVISETDPVDVEPEDAPTLRSLNSKEWWSDYYNRAVFFCDELGTMPPFDILPLFSAGRSRRLTLVPIIQSLAQLEKNYGKEGSEIMCDNCQDTIFGGFAPNSQTANTLSGNLGSRTVLSGTVTKGKNDDSQSLQMMERPLMSPDELKSMPKGSFVVMKTGTHPMKTKLKLFFEWGIQFQKPLEMPDRGSRPVYYAGKQDLERSILSQFPMIHMPMGAAMPPRVQTASKPMPAQININTEDE